MGIDGNLGVLNGIVPVVVVVHVLAVPAAVMALQRRMVPLHAGIGAGHDQAFTAISQVPDVGSLDARNVPLDAVDVGRY